MSARCPGSELLLELSCELLEEEEAARLTAHVSDCLACQAQQDLLGTALAAPPEPAPPAEVLEALHRRIDEAEGRDQPPVPGEETVVRLLCTYCKDDLLKDEATFCAGCLAPHHDDCFVEHGRCSIAGCESKTTVRGVDVVQPPTKRRKLKAGLLLFFSAVVGGAGVAALVGPSHVSAVRFGKESAPDLTHREETYDVADLVRGGSNRPSSSRRVEALLQRAAPTMVGEVSLREVLEALRQRANLDTQIDPRAAPLLDRKVVLAGEGLSIQVLLTTALQQAGAVLNVADETYEVRPAGAGKPGTITIVQADRVDPSRARVNTSLFGLKGKPTLDPEGLRLLVRAHCGPVWAPPAALELADGRLRVVQTEAQHRTIRKLLSRLSSGKRPEQPRPWSYPAIAPAVVDCRVGAVDGERWEAELQESLRRSVELTTTGDLAALVTRLHTLTKIPFALSQRRGVRQVKAFQATIDGPLDTQLDALLSARGLGLALLNHAVWIVPREEANLEPARVAAFLKQPVGGESQVGATLAGLVARLGPSICEAQPFGHSRARMFFPATLTRGEVLELARLQGGIDARVEFEGDTPRITLFAGPAPLVQAHALREELLDPNLPAHQPRIARPLLRPLRKRRRAFDAAFLALHEASNTVDCGFDRVKAAMLALGQADRALRDLLEVSTALVDDGALERAQRVRAEAFLAHQSRWNEAVRTNDPRLGGLLALREQVSAPQLEAAAAEAAWLEAVRSRTSTLRQGWGRTFTPNYRDWKATVQAEARARVRVGLARLRRFGVAFDLEADRPRVVALMPGRAGAAGGIRVGDEMRGRPRYTCWDLLWDLGAPKRTVVNLRFERGRGLLHFTADLSPTSPKGASKTRR